MPNSTGLISAVPMSTTDVWAEKGVHPLFLSPQDMEKSIHSLKAGTLIFGLEPEQTKQLGLLDIVLASWAITSLDETTVTNKSLRDVLDTFRTAALRPTRVGKRYANAALELRDMLHPELSIQTLGEMCGVSDRGFRDWLRGAGVREKRSRRLMTNRAIVKALVLRMGRDGAIQWLQLPHGQLGGSTPVDALKHEKTERVLELAMAQVRRSPRPHSIIPAVEDADTDPSIEKMLAARGQLDDVEIYDLL